MDEQKDEHTDRQTKCSAVRSFALLLELLTRFAYYRYRCKALRKLTLLTHFSVRTNDKNGPTSNGGVNNEFEMNDARILDAG